MQSFDHEHNLERIAFTALFIAFCWCAYVLLLDFRDAMVDQRLQWLRDKAASAISTDIFNTRSERQSI